jgi:hypothetical protein
VGAQKYQGMVGRSFSQWLLWILRIGFIWSILQSDIHVYISIAFVTLKI